MSLEAFVELINDRVLRRFNTEMVGGFDEPYYAAAQEHIPAQIQFRYDYFRSALHELAHWCVAGDVRRLLDDYGYWYAPDGRNQDEQAAFFNVEVKPQAIEWAFAMLCQLTFDVSVDNLDQSEEVTGINEFKQSVKTQLLDYIETGFPERAQEILELLLKHYHNTSGTTALKEFLLRHILTSQTD